MLAHAERLGIVERIAHPLGDLLRVPEAQVPLLGYFRNNVLHLFVLPALIACLLGNIRNVDATRLLGAVRGIQRLMGAELFLRWSVDELPVEMGRIITVFAERGLLRHSEDSTHLNAPETYSQEFDELHLIGETLRPTLGRHFLALSLLQERGSGTMTRRQLEGDCHLLAQRLSMLGGFSSAEVTDQSAFSVLVANLLDSELLKEDEAGRLQFDQHLVEPLAYSELVLPADARQAIRRMAAMPVQAA
ncbi:MAG: glycerol-3-phosphate O-acyltransferase [Pseudomonadota bacterium]|nr:glycerol-3-phosphate O-acyltransferase [Pseudomonadota bacterium]